MHLTALKKETYFTPTSIMFFQQDDGSNEINTMDETISYYDAEEETIEQSGVTTTEYTIEPTENADSKDTLGIGSYYYNYLSRELGRLLLRTMHVFICIIELEFITMPY